MNVHDKQYTFLESKPKINCCNTEHSIKNKIQAVVVLGGGL